MTYHLTGCLSLWEWASPSLVLSRGGRLDDAIKHVVGIRPVGMVHVPMVSFHAGTNFNY